MAAEEELRARAVLAEMLMRISQGPHAALSIAETASAEDVRAAFLQLTKQFHPARFGRMSGEIHKLANEVFLGIKSAHDQLTKQLGSSGRASSSQTGIITTQIPRLGTMPGGTERGVVLPPRASTPQFARGTDRANHRPSSPHITPPARPRPLTPPAAGTRAGTPPPSTQQITTQAPRVGTPALGVPVRLGTPQHEQGQRASTPAGEQGHRASTPPLDLGHQGHRARTPSGTRPSASIPAQRPGSPPPRPTTPPAPGALDPPTIRYSGVHPTQPPAAKHGAGVFDEQAELRAAMDMLAARNYVAARQALHALAAKMPQSRHYRALLCYARGREAAASGRSDDAVMEFQRALQLDSELEIAKQAIRELGRKGRG